MLGLVPAAGAALAGWLLRRQRVAGALGALTGSALLFLGAFAAWGVSGVDACKAPRPLVRALLAEQDEADIRVASYRYFQPSLVFYCRRQVVPLHDDAQALEYLRYPIEVYLFLPAEEWQRLHGQLRTPCRLLARHHDLYRNCEVVLVTNR
jgi:hypothetical protein